MTDVRLTPITDAELLSKIKNTLNITGENFDDTLTLYIEEVKGYMSSAGVNAKILGSTLAVGCISRGVADLWNYGNGDTKLSEYFYQRAAQLRCIGYGTDTKVKVTLLGSVIKNNFVVQENTKILNIGIEGFNHLEDDLQLFVNGLKFDADRYTVNSNNTVTLDIEVIEGTAIEFVILKLERVKEE